MAFLAEPPNLDAVAASLASLGSITRIDETVVVALADGPPASVEADRVTMPSEGLVGRLRRDPFVASRLDLAKAALAVRATLACDAPLGALGRLYRVGETATAGRALLWYDVDKQRAVDREEVALLANDDVLPAISDGIEIDCVYSDVGSPTCWLHTHGVSRFGRPDVEAFAVPRAVLREAGGLVNDVAAWLLSHDVPTDTVEAVLPDGAVWLEPLAHRLERLPSGTFGKQLADRSPAERELTQRVAIVLPRSSGRGRVLRRTFTHDLEPLLRRRSDTRIRPMTKTEGDRLAAIARRTRPLLQRLWDAREAGWTFLVKLGLPNTREPAVREHLWFDAIEIDGSRFVGRLANDPESVDLRIGEVVERDLALATDWRVRVGEQAYGPTRAHRLAPAASGLR